jgi:hypothetical protein
MAACPTCGKVNPDGGKFCGYCRASMQVSSPPAQSPQQSSEAACGFVTITLLVALVVGGVFAVRHFMDGGSKPANARPASANTSAKGHTRSLTIPGTARWTDAGVSVKAGESVAVAATGLVRIAGSDPGKTPDGDGSGSCALAAATTANASCWALIGRVGQNGVPFGVGAAKTFAAPTDGELWLGVNDDDLGDNSGQWSVAVTLDASAPAASLATAASVASQPPTQVSSPILSPSPTPSPTPAVPVQVTDALSVVTEPDSGVKPGMGRVKVAVLGVDHVLASAGFYMYKPLKDANGITIPGDSVAQFYAGKDGIATTDLAPGQYIIRSADGGYEGYLAGMSWGDAKKGSGYDEVVVQSAKTTTLTIRMGRIDATVRQPNGDVAVDAIVYVFLQTTDANGRLIKGGEVNQGGTQRTGTWSQDVTPGTYAVQWGYGGDITFNVVVKPGVATAVNYQEH